MPILGSLATRGFGVGVGSSATPYLGPYGAFDALASTTVGAGGVSYVEFSGIPTGYKHLQLRCTMVCSAVNNMYLQVGVSSIDESANNHGWHQLYSDSSSVLANGVGSTNFVYIGYNNTATYPNASIVDIYDYTDPNKYTTMKTLAGGDSNGTGFVQFWGGHWKQSLPVNVLRITPGSGTFSQHGVFSLYGIR